MLDRSSSRASRRRPLTLGAVAAVAVVFCSLVPVANAQFFPFFSSQPRRPVQVPHQQQQPQFPFSPFGGSIFNPPQRAEPRADYSRAPAPRKPDTPPTTKVVVMGDSMADWLAYGLEEVFSETPDIGVMRKHRTNSGLIRYDQRPDSSWAQTAREIIAAEKPDVIVMMVGVNDRQAMRDRQAVPAPAQKKGPGDPQAAPAPDQPRDEQAANQKQAEPPAADPSQYPEDASETPLIAPEPAARAGNSPLLEFHSDRWAAVYAKRVDETIAALKSANVPVIWVGLPALRGTRSTADMVYLDGLFRAAAEKASIVYTDVWDGFVDEGGKFTVEGPDFEGQIRRLRAGDGVHFTKPGAAKLAHYVEHDITRLIANRALPVALPGPDVAPQPQQAAKPSGPAARPLVGQVVLLNTDTTSSDELLGGSSTRPAQLDPVAAAVLVRGEAMTPPLGRADDFSWPRGDLISMDPANVPGPSPMPAAPVKDQPVAAARRPSVASGEPRPRRAPGFEQREAAGQQRAPVGPSAFNPFWLFR